MTNSVYNLAIWYICITITLLGRRHDPKEIRLLAGALGLAFGRGDNDETHAPGCRLWGNHFAFWNLGSSSDGRSSAAATRASGDTGDAGQYDPGDGS